MFARSSAANLCAADIDQREIELSERGQRCIRNVTVAEAEHLKIRHVG